MGGTAKRPRQRSQGAQRLSDLISQDLDSQGKSIEAAEARTLTWSIPDEGAAASTIARVLVTAFRGMTLYRVWVLKEAAIAASTADYATLSLQSLDTQGHTTVVALQRPVVVASLSTKETPVNSYQPFHLEIQKSQVPQGRVLRLSVAKTGLGVQLGGFILGMDFSYGRVR